MRPLSGTWWSVLLLDVVPSDVQAAVEEGAVGFRDEPRGPERSAPLSAPAATGAGTTEQREAASSA